MKKVIFAALIAATSFPPSQAQLFSSQSIGGAVVGGIAGGLIGGHRHRGEGIAIGAGVGLLLGTVAEREARARAAWTPVYYPQPVYVVNPAPVTVVTNTVVITEVAPQVQQPSVPPVSTAMSSANSLFGR